MPYPVAYVMHGDIEVVISTVGSTGVKEGQNFLVYSIGPEIVDPITGNNLGRLEIVVGKGKVVHVQDYMATIRSSETTKMPDVRKSFVPSPDRPGFGTISSMFSTSSVKEEIIPGKIVVAPFKNPRVGDLAKLVS